MSALILTATLSPADFAWADSLRRAHYPSDRNQVPAHITLFRHLPPSIEAELLARLKTLVVRPPPAATLAGLIDLGTGVALRIESPGLIALRADLADAFTGLLTPQDQAPPRLHLTIQNKVPRAEAKALRANLERDFRQRPIGIAGLAAWHYLDGPWHAICAYSFRGRL